MEMDCRDMGMCFAATKKVNNLLFKGWNVSSVGEMIGTMFAAFVFAAFYESLKAGIAFHYNRPEPKSCHQKSNEEQESLVSNTHQIQFRLGQHTIKTVIYVGNLLYAYILMLVAMSYNVWLFLALVLGLGFGYFVSQPLFQSFLVTSKVKQFKSYGSTHINSKTI